MFKYLDMISATLVAICFLAMFFVLIDIRNENREVLERVKKLEVECPDPEMYERGLIVPGFFGGIDKPLVDPI